MIIKKLDREENRLTKPLYEAVFSEDRGPFADYYYEWAARDNTIYAACDENGIHSMIHLNPYPVEWNGKIVMIPYIAAVATQKDMRRRGLMRQIFELIFDDLKKQGVPFAFLMPVDENIYLPFGFKRGWNWQWEEDAVGAARGDDSIILKYDDLTGKDSGYGDSLLKELSDNVNAALRQRYDLFTHRSVYYYRKLAAEQEASGGQLRILLEGGRPKAAVQTSRDLYPPMMYKMTGEAAEEEKMRRTFICEVV